MKQIAPIWKPELFEDDRDHRGTPRLQPLDEQERCAPAPARAGGPSERRHPRKPPDRSRPRDTAGVWRTRESVRQTGPTNPTSPTDLTHPPSVHARVASARVRLRDAGLSLAEADLGARLLAEHLLGWDAARYFTSGGEPERDGFARSYDALVSRRAAREPLAYIIGRQEFWDLPFEMSPAVLIPRPETELIVEAALDMLRERHGRPDAPGQGAGLRIADACTGCGCVAIALARELPHAQIVGTDISDAALGVARRNAARHGVDRRVTFVRTDVLAGLSGPFDAIVANPPYVRSGDRPGLQPEVREHEPGVALFGGADGVDIVARLVAQAWARLRADAPLIFEFGFGQDMAVEQLISEAPGLTMIGLRRDLQGIARTAIAKRL